MSGDRPIRALVPLAEGFEEIEAVVPIDLFRRAGWEVVSASLREGPVTASRQTRHLADALLDKVIGDDVDLIYLPGGLPGADHLAACAPLVEKIRHHHEQGGWLAAICAAPRVLARAGVLAGRRFTVHPTSHDAVLPFVSVNERIVVDGRLITGIGAGASFELALHILASVSGSPQTARQVNQGLLCPESLLP